MDPFLYQYGVGGIVFGVGCFYAWRQGYLSFEGRGLKNLLLLVGGLIFMMGLQGYLQYAPMAETLPPVTATGSVADKALGTPLDYGIMVGYFLGILAVGTLFGSGQKSTKDFFFGGQRFSWWLIAMSLVATTIGSYSFVKYSRVAYLYGLSSSQTYLNDWLLMPLLLFGWLPLLYFSRVTSIPEYFERRFGPAVRLAVTLSLLVYLIGYVGVNLFTMGKALNILVGWEIPTAALVVAAISAFYVTLGGQTSVIMTDLLQGLMLVATGVIIFYLGMEQLGGWDGFWLNLPRGHKQAFSPFNAHPDFPAVGIFWQDAMANSAMYYFLNQGIIMRFLAARSVNEGRRAMIAVPLLLMPIAAMVVASGGWIGKAMVGAGLLPPDVAPGAVFFVVADTIARPGVFGLVMAALTAALMSTVDSLITAVSAIVVNDLYKPYINPEAKDKTLLKVARVSAITVTLLGVALVPIFMMFNSIYEAHGAFTAAVTPPMVVALMLSVFWRRYTAKAALATLIGGMGAVLFSIMVPEVITPFAHGVPPVDVGEGLFAGAKQHKFMRAFFGIVVSGGLGVVVSLFTQPEGEDKMKGLVWGSVAAALKHYKGSPGDENALVSAMAQVNAGPCPLPEDGSLPEVAISAPLADALKAKAGDLLYVSDTRWWLGGLKSAHMRVGRVISGEPSALITMPEALVEEIVAKGRVGLPVKVDRMY